MSTDYLTVSFYDPGTGEMMGSLSGTMNDVLAVKQPYLLGQHDRRTHFVDLSQSPPQAIRRPAMPIRQNKTKILADGEDFLTLSDIPAESVLFIGDALQPDAISDGLLEYATHLPGTLEFRLAKFPYLDWVGEVAAVAYDPCSDAGGDPRGA